MLLEQRVAVPVDERAQVLALLAHRVREVGVGVRGERVADGGDFFVVNVSCPNSQGFEALQNRDAMADISDGFAALAADAGISLPKEFADIRLLMTRFEGTNPLHVAMMDAFRNVFGAVLTGWRVSVGTAVMLGPLVPKALALQAPVTTAVAATARPTPKSLA